jgi:hypothetical protein
MKRILLNLIPTLSCVLLVSCESVPPEDRGPDHTSAYYMQVQASVPGITIETNSVVAGVTPLTLKIFGDVTGEFHNFGSREYVLRAVPSGTNQFVQTRVFRTGNHSAPGDHIPGLVFFDMSQPGGGVSIDSIPER